MKDKEIIIEMPYIKKAAIVETQIKGYICKALLIHFFEPVKIISTLEEHPDKALIVGNFYLPSELWQWAHKLGMKRTKRFIFKSLSLDESLASLLFTGVDMDCVAIASKRYKEIEVYSIVTAGVTSNALRSVYDEGRFLEGGTINIIILMNRKLTPPAMKRAIITATEAKTVVLQELDIRSSLTPMINQATGTGTDNIIVIQGKGPSINFTGGHTRVGELIAKTVYQAVKEAIKKKDSIGYCRDVFQRLNERGLTLKKMLSMANLPEGINISKLESQIELLLQDPLYKGFVLSALRLSDCFYTEPPELFYAFNKWALFIAETISGCKIGRIKRWLTDTKLPEVLETTFNALLSGLLIKNKLF